MNKKQTIPGFIAIVYAWCFLILMLFSTAGHVYTGWQEHNGFLKDYDKAPEPLSRYLHPGHFLQATFGNRESEFFQLALCGSHYISEATGFVGVQRLQ